MALCVTGLGLRGTGRLSVPLATCGLRLGAHRMHGVPRMALQEASHSQGWGRARLHAVAACWEGWALGDPDTGQPWRRRAVVSSPSTFFFLF